MPEPSTLASWTRALCKLLDARAIDSQALCRAAGLDPTRMEDPRARYPLSATTRLWQLAVAASGDPALGLQVSRYLSPTTFHALGYAVSASATLLELFERLVRYHQVVSDALSPRLQGVAHGYVFSLELPPGQALPAAEALDAFMAIHVRTCRRRLGRDWAPLAVHLQRPAPADPQPWREVFRAPLYFAAEQTRLEFRREDLQRPLGDANPELAEHNEMVLRRALAHLQGPPWTRRVRALIEDRLPAGEPSAQAVADSLHISLRSLQRHLGGEGASFEGLLALVRQGQAEKLLADPGCSLGEAAYLLGFADTSSFSRAFKRWSGQTPSQFRAARSMRT